MEGGLSEGAPTLAGFTGWRSSGSPLSGLASWLLSVCLSLACRAKLCRPFPGMDSRRAGRLDRRTDSAVAFCPGRISEGWGGKGVAAPPHFCSELQLFPVSTFRTGYLSLVARLIIHFETSVSRTSHLWMVCSPREGCWTMPTFWELLHGFRLGPVFPASQSFSLDLVWPKGRC